MEIYEILPNFKGVKRAGENKYIACCPAHDDQHPSLSIFLSEDGTRIILHCFVGCSEDEILKCLGLKKTDLYTSKSKLRKKTKSKPIAQYKYRYTDENGNLAYLKIRNEYADKSKDFSFEQPNGERNLQGVHRVIYNLPEVLSSPRIYLTEGEKDANILIKNGLTATTLDTGANSVWLDYYDDYFIDKEVIILPDNDEAGFLYAKNILIHLPNAKVLNLPDLKEKEDVYDWLMAGHTIEELGELPSMSKSEFLSGQAVGKAKDTVNKGNGKGKETAPETVIRLIVEESDAKLFSDTANDTYAAVTVDNHIEVWDINGSDFNIWLNGLYYKETNKPIRKDSLAQATAILSAKARFDNKETIPLSTRVAKTEDAFWYSLSNRQWQAVKITPDGWEVDDHPPILFKQYRHQLPQVAPKSNGDIYKIFNYLNIKEYHTLFLCWLISCFIPDIPHPMPIFYGEKGAAKSTSCTLLKKLIDPSALETLTIQYSAKSMAVNLQQHWFLPFDNVSHINAELSDTLCRAITGGGIQQRKLFSNADDYIFTFKRCLALNGINNVATRSDLLDRAILIELSRISEDKRRELSEIQRDFEKDLPYILGGVFDVLSKAMRIYPDVKLDKLPRMADFARWGYAIGEALGDLGQLFLDEYRINYNRQNIEVLNSSVASVLMINFMKNRESWRGRVSDLLNEFYLLAPSLGISTKSKEFPTKANVLSRRLNALKSNLKSVGIVFYTDPKADATYITIENKNISPLPPYQISISDNLIFNNGDNLKMSSDDCDNNDNTVSF